jgi:hypothetical protein
MKYLIIFLSIFLFSCGAKKLNKDIKKTDSIAKQVSVIKKDCTAIQIKQVNFDVTTDELTIEAKDTSKPIEITNSNGKVTKYKNAVLRHKKRKDNTLVIEEKKVVKNVLDSLNNETKVNKVESKKIVDKKQFSWSTFILDLWWLWLLIILALYLSYKRFINV